ncbi:MAG TPA: hypothetical protein VII49_14210 [Rhizomicrobium sp.]
MKSALEFLLGSENGEEILAFLRSRGPRAHIIAPAWIRRRVTGGKRPAPGHHGASWSEDGNRDVPVDRSEVNIVVIAEDAEREQAVVSSLALRKGAKVYGLFGHIVPALLCSRNGMAAGLPVEGLKRYAILCIPRSGSRYLSAVLSNRGIGAPREHIREPLASVMAEGRLGFAGGIEALEQFGQRNGIFGTKLISTFLLRASHGRVSELQTNFSWLVERGYRLMHLERSLDDAVISSYIAFQLRKWHFFGQVDEDTRATLDSLEFDDGAAWEEFIRFRAEKMIVDALAGALRLPKVAYAEIESNIDDVVSDICHLIDVDPGSLTPGSAQVPISTKSESPTYAVFAERLGGLLERRAADADPSTVKKLGAIGKLSQEAAEALVAGGPLLTDQDR